MNWAISMHNYNTLYRNEWIGCTGLESQCKSVPVTLTTDFLMGCGGPDRSNGSNGRWHHAWRAPGVTFSPPQSLLLEKGKKNEGFTF